LNLLLFIPGISGDAHADTGQKTGPAGFPLPHEFKARKPAFFFGRPYFRKYFLYWHEC